MSEIEQLREENDSLKNLIEILRCQLERFIETLAENHQKKPADAKQLGGKELDETPCCASSGFDPLKHSNIRACKCGREYNFVIFMKDGHTERPTCSFCSDKNEKCPVCGKPVTSLPWVSDNGRRVHSDNGNPSSLPCNVRLELNRLIETLAENHQKKKTE